MSGPVAEIKEVSFSFGTRPVLENVSLKIEAGDFLLLIGPNGSGKTTLLKIMLGLIKPWQGRVCLFGRELGSFRDWYRVGYVSQKATGFDARFPATAEEVVLAGRIARSGLGRRLGAGDREAALEALRVVGMEDCRNALIGNLSGGQQQRVFIARALAGNPELLVLDEPSAGLDSRAMDSFYAMLGKLNQAGITVVTVSHDIGAVPGEVNRVACVNRRLVCHGSPARVLTPENLASLYGMPVSVISHRH
ncbi:MAG: metal ABC transporter ATP-binding protein [Bacillota bacterium]